MLLYCSIPVFISTLHSYLLVSNAYFYRTYYNLHEVIITFTKVLRFTASIYFYSHHLLLVVHFYQFMFLFAIVMCFLHHLHQRHSLLALQLRGPTKHHRHYCSNYYLPNCAHSLQTMWQSDSHSNLQVNLHVYLWYMVVSQHPTHLVKTAIAITTTTTITTLVIVPIALIDTTINRLQLVFIRNVQLICHYHL